MNLVYVPLLRVMRDLHAIPRGQPPDFNGLARFRQYLRTIFPQDDQAEQLLPLLAMNPMGKEHVARLLDALLAMDADGIGAQVVSEVAAELADVPGDFKIGLVVADDLMGAGTNRFHYEFTLRFGPDELRSGGGQRGRPKWLKDYWITCALWASETPIDEIVRSTVLAAAYRAAYVQQHGPARTLGEMLTQEGAVLARAGHREPMLEADDLDYTREVLAPFLGAADMRTCIECLFGDTAGRTLGFTPRGLSPWAGIALALHEARSRSEG